MRRSAILAAALLLLGGCASQPLPRDHYYRLEVEPPRTSAAPYLKGTVEVASFRADGLVADRPLTWVTADAPHELQVYHYHQWTAPPAALLQDALVEHLRGAGIADRVVTPELRAAPDFVVVGRLRRLEMVTGATPAVLVDLELALREINPDRVVLVKSYRERRAVSDESIGTAVLAMGEVVTDLYARFTADLATR